MPASSPPSPGGRDALIERVAAAEAALHTHAMRLVPPLPIPPDLTIRQLQVLALVRATPGVSGQGLADLLGVSLPTVSGLLERVEDKGWVDRQHDPEDRRRLLLGLTPAAEELLDALERPAQEIRQGLLDVLDEQDLSDLARVVERLAAAAAQQA